MDRFQFRRDTSARWTSINPILLEGEIGIETDTKLRKMGDGTNTWNNLDYLAAENITQELGDSETATVSQKTITLNLMKREAVHNTSLLLSNNFIFKKGLVLNTLGVIMENSAGYFSTESFFLIDDNISQVTISNLFGNTTATAAGICFYNDSQTFIGYYNGNSAGYFDVKIQDIIVSFQGAVYFRICGFADLPIIANSYSQVAIDSKVNESEYTLDNSTICSTMLNAKGKEFYSFDGWDNQSSCFLAANTGKYTDSSGVEGYFYVTPFILVKDISKIKFEGATYSNVSFYVFYDATKSVISQVNGDSNVKRETVINIPNNAYYIRFCGNVKFSLRVSVIDSIYKQYIASKINSLQDASASAVNASLVTNSLYFKNDKCILKNNGDLLNDASYTMYKVSDYIDINYLLDFKFIKLEAWRAAQANPMAFYDKDFKVIGTAYNPAPVNTETSADITLDSQLIAQYPNAKYVRIGIRTTYNWSIIPPFINSLNLFDDAPPYPSYRYNMFENVLFGGDSVTQGFVTEGTPTKQYIYKVMPEYAYPLQFAKIHPKLNVTIQARSGISCIGWLADFYPTINFSQYDLFIVELGLNGYLDINDINTEGTNTYAYKQIIAGVRAQNPDITIVLVRSQYFGSNWMPVLEAISSEYDCIIIDLHDTTYLDLADPIYHGYYQNGDSRAIDYAHFTRKGYNVKAYVVSRLLADKLTDSTIYK